MLGLSSGLIKGTSVLKSIVKKSLQAWYKADKTQAPLGEEEIANGSFTTGPELFSNASNWIFDGDRASYNTSTGVLTIDNSSGGGGARQSVTTSIGDTFLCTFTIDSISGYAGGDGVYFRVAATEGTTRTAAGTYSEYITVASVTGTDDRIDIRGNDDGTATISNISVKKTNPNDSWTVVNPAVVKDGEGTLSGAGARLEQTVLTTGKTYKYSFKAKSPSASGYDLKIDSPLNTNKVTISNVPETYTNYSGTFIAGSANVIFKESGIPGVTISDVSIKEITNSVKDFSPNNNNGVLYSGKALGFDGSADYIDIDYWKSKTIDVNTKASFAVWFNDDNVSTGDFIFGTNTSASNFFYLGVIGGKLELGWHDSGWQADANSIAVADNTWYRAVAVIDGYTCSVYLNGELAFSKTTASDFTLHATGLSIGCQGDAVGDFWDGELADFQIYDKAWSASDVTYDYNNPDKDVFDDEGRTEVLGAEKLSNTDFNTDSIWSKYNSADINATVSNALYLPNGGAYVTQSAVIESSKFYKYTVVAKSETDTLSDLRLQTGSTIQKTIEDVPTSYTTYTGIIPSDATGFTLSEGGGGALIIDSISIKEVLTHTGEISPTDCTALYRLNEGAGNRVYNAAPVLSAELIDNSDFNLGESGFTTESKLIGDGGSSSITIANGKATYNIVNGENVYLRQLFGIVSGRTYKLSITVKGLSGLSATSNQIRVQDDIDESRLGIDPNPLQIDLDGTLQTVETVWTAGSGSDSVMVMRNDGGVNDSYSFEVHNLSVKEISLSDSYALVGDPAWASAQPYIPQYAMSSYSKKMVFGGAGSGDYVDLGSEVALAADEAASISFWFTYGTTDTSTDKYILGRTSSAVDYLSINPQSNDGGIIYDKIQIRMNNVVSAFNIETDLSLGKLYHCVLTMPAYSSGSEAMKCYINGVLQSDTENRTNNAWNFQRIGGHTGTVNNFDGILDEIAYFTKELSQAEVQEIFNAGMALDCRDHSASSDLTGYWRNNGVDTWTDLSTNSNNGTVNGSPTTIQLQEVPYFKKDTFGLPMNRVREKGLNFDGDSYVRIDSDSSLTSPSVSVESWIKMKETPESLLGVVSKYESSGNNPWLLSVKTNLFVSWYQNGGTSSLIAGDQNEDKMSIDTWRHVVATYDGTVSSNNTRQIYIDGVLRKTDQQTNTDRDGPILDPNNEVVEIGRYGENITKADNVMIDDVKIYNRVLSASEIKKNYKATKSKHKNNLTSNWSDDFDDGFI